MKKRILTSALILPFILQAGWQKKNKEEHQIKEIKEVVANPLESNLEKITPLTSKTVLLEEEKNKDCAPLCIRKICIHNTITDAEATYTKHWSGNHTPIWKLSINGKEINSKEKVEIEVAQDSIEAEFSFEFKALGKTYRTGAACARFEVPKDAESFDLGFSWDNEARLALSNTTPEASKTQPKLISFFEKK